MSSVCTHLENRYSNYLKMYTDGSVLENGNAGAAFVIPTQKIEKQYHMGRLYSIFTAELVAILMALNHILNVPMNICQILLCVDSKSALQAIRSPSKKTRLEMTFEIKHVIHLLSIKGISVTFCWVPSHCGIYANEWVDQAARKAALNFEGSSQLSIPLDLHECYRCIEKVSRDRFHNTLKASNSQYYEYCVMHSNATNPKSFLDKLLFKHSRQITSLVYRFRLNAFRTKYCANVPVSYTHLTLPTIYSV
eukprot:TRINITY_DN5491_c0_g1_i10.p1 TRINITY_DN5491_c0_g1~~TRINITY_DN5491_c0_g1_i10.p1  ORF type:complete len:250 (-),score=-9.43 TRINITY_DN5491_c0_g1_i10:9-758(-)